MRVLTHQFRAVAIFCAVLIPGWAAVAAPHNASNKTSVPFRTAAGTESVVSVTASSPGTRWDKPGAEAAIASVYLDGHYNQDIAVDRGSTPTTYRIFLGPLTAGEHRLAVERNNQWSAPHAPLEVQKIVVTSASSSDREYTALAHAPILFARADTVGHFSDIPLLAWYEVFPNAGGEEIQYSYVFSNEDAGTPAGALMARWGRTTDIEYAYRVWLDRTGNVQRETFQGFSHRNTPFHGRKDGKHPYFLVATPNNVFADTGTSEIQYHMLPVKFDLSHHSREELMDRFPWTYQIMAEELKRENKLRHFGRWSLTKVSDPRNYLYLEFDSQEQNAGLKVWVRAEGSPRLYSSNAGYPQLAIWRSGWFRTTVELPPGTTEESIQEIGLECIPRPDLNSGNSRAGQGPEPPECQLHRLSKVFLLGPNYKPGGSILATHAPMTMKPGTIYLLAPMRTGAATSP